MLSARFTITSDKIADIGKYHAAGLIPRPLILIQFFWLLRHLLCGIDASSAGAQSNKRIAKVKFPEGFLAFI